MMKILEKPVNTQIFYTNLLLHDGEDLTFETYEEYRCYCETIYRKQYRDLGIELAPLPTKEQIKLIEKQELSSAWLPVSK